MKAFVLTAVLVSALTACTTALAETAAVKPRATTRPASAPASRPASPDAPLTTERRKAFNLALKEAREAKNPRIEEARQKFHSEMEQKQKKAENVAEKAEDNAQVAAGKRNVEARRRHGIRALKQQQKVLKNERTIEKASEKADQSQEQYAAGFAALTRLEDIWHACREYAVDKEYEQWTRAAAAKHRAESELTKINTKLLTPNVKIVVDGAESSVREEVLKLGTTHAAAGPK